MSWLDAYDKPIDEVEEIIEIPIEVEPLDETPLEDLGLNTCNHEIPLSFKKVYSFDEPNPQPQPLPNYPPLDISLGDQRGPEPPIKPHSLDSFRMKVVDNLTILTPPSPHVAFFHPKDISFYYRPCVDDPKKHYRFKPGLLGQSESPGVDLLNWKEVENNLLRGLSLPDKPNELKKEVIQKGNGPVSVSIDTNGQIKVLPPKTAEEVLARERERKVRTTLLMALPEDHLAKFHKMTDAKKMWDAIKSRFGGNDESKKMQKYILKQQFEGFSVSNSEGLHKGYDGFQSLLSQLEIHGAGVSTEDANQKFLRSLPSSWSQVSLIMRTKPGVDSLSFDDLYNNLRVFKYDVKGSNRSYSNAHNVSFISFKSTSSTNDVSTAYGVSTSSGQNSQRENSSSYTDELMYSFFANQSSSS
ncbi:hypothetical protein Tco_0173884 [Tanacetum coccineum]